MFVCFCRLYPEKCEVKKLTHYAAPDRITFEEALKGSFSEVSVGQEFGPTLVLAYPIGMNQGVKCFQATAGTPGFIKAVNLAYP